MKKTILSLTVASVLAGCSTVAVDKLESRVLDKRDAVESSLKKAVPADASPVAFLDSSFVPMRKMERQDYTSEQRAIMGLEIETNRNFQSLNEIAGWLSSIANVPVFLNPELMAPIPGQPTQPMGNMGMPGMPPTMPGMPLPTQNNMMGPNGMPMQMQMNMATGIAAKPFTVAYSGRLSGFLDMVAANYGIYTKLEGRNIRFLLTDSRTFRIKALPGDTQLSSIVGSVSNTSGSGGMAATSGTSSGTSANSTGVTFAGMSVWSGIEIGIKQLLTPGTGKVAVSPSTGTVSVTDTPRVLEQVADFVREQNAALGRQVAVNVRVLSVEVNDADNYGINWNAVYNNLTDNVAVKVTSALPVAATAAQFLVQTSTPSAGSWGAASGAIISALSTQGRVSELTSATLVTLNNQPAPVNVGRQISYLASSSTTTTTNAGTTTSLTPGQVQTGFSMVLIPHIIDGKEILIQSSINLSSLLQLATITSGTSSIQSPDISTSNFIQRTRMMSGDTLVMAGFDQDKLSAVSNGVGEAKNTIFGSRDSSGKRTMLVILLQPTVSI
jgi:type IVB pilus formation R64 PilN family outer membrane protein